MRLVAIALLLLLLSPVALAEDPPPAKATATTADTMDGSDKLAKYKEDLPASRFVLIAYMIVWSGLFVFLLSLKKRQSTLDSRIDELERALAAHDGKDAS